MIATPLNTKGGLQARALAALSYLGFLCFVPLFVNKDDEFVHFHAKQGLVLWAWMIVAVFALYIPGVGKAAFNISLTAISLLTVMGLVSVAMNRAWKLPVINTLSDRV